jgi:diphthamide synthase (EF-2-diphthine--ammonia ligase)
MVGVYPVWGRDTRKFLNDFIVQGFKAVVVCVDGEKLHGEFAGRMIDAEFLADLPPGIDPCGENGEFHTFVFDGPIFEAPVAFSLGERVRRGSFWFCDLIPEPNGVLGRAC